MCGRDVEPSALEPVLPSGREFEAEQRVAEDNTSECSVFVDNVDVLTVSEYRGQDKFDVMEFVRENPGRFAHPEKSDVGDDTVRASTDGRLVAGLGDVGGATAAGSAPG